MYEVRCIFCKNYHRSEFFDDIEDSILRCRDAAPNWQRGLLSEFPDDTRPVSIEASMAMREAERRRDEPGVMYGV